MHGQVPPFPLFFADADTLKSLVQTQVNVLPGNRFVPAITGEKIASAVFPYQYFQILLNSRWNRNVTRPVGFDILISVAIVLGTYINMSLVNKFPKA
jgi:hypothetical protein